MSMYDLVFLLSQEEDTKTIKQLVAAHKGKLLEEKHWGKKLLSYSIKKKNEAHFFEWKLELEPAELQEFKKKLTYNEKLMRYLLVKAD